MSLRVNLLLDFKVVGQTIVLEAQYDNKVNPSYEFIGRTVGLNLKLTDILNDLLKKLTGEDVKDLLPDDLLPDLDLKDIYISYKTDSGEINFIAITKLNGKEIQFVFHYRLKKDAVAKRYAFGIRTNISDLTGLPLVGKEMKDVKLTGLGFIYTSFDSSVSGDNVFNLPKLSGTKGKRIISRANPETLNSGINFSGELNLPLLPAPFSLSMPVSKNENVADPVDKKPAAPKDSLSANTKWFKLNKKIGSLTVGQIGFRYKDNMLVLLISGDMTIAALTVSLNGLGIGFEVSKLFKKKFEPSFHLDGMGIAYSAPPIEISGAFVRTQQEINNETIDVFNGGAIIKASQFTISAIGSYAKVKGQTSLFIYGVFDGPIGGPAFFFVTGIAIGFGYNRRVNIPTIEEVALFPLVALAMQPQNDGGLPAILSSLDTPMKNGKRPIEISLGDYWLAVGIKFTSFKLIESFVLLTVNFGTRLEFAILGLSRLSWPEKSIATEPIVYIELAILAHFGPDSDVIAVEAIITPNSYILSKDCKLTGGFAFYTWVKGPHEGDFVITLGGYHPKFDKPAHYPTVPRLGLSWKIGKLLSIKGGLYFALTSSAIMAGGKWEVLFKTSVVKASIVLWADMLIFWAPFQYTIDVGITIKIEANIKIAFVRVHFSLEMTAQLHIWGPPFAGEAYVDWTIFSFTIPFGDHAKKAPEKLTWSEFSSGFVPQKKVGTGPDPINVTISNGLIDVKGEEKFPVINPQGLAISIDSFIPVTELKVNQEAIDDLALMTTATQNISYDQRQKAIGIRPCGFDAESIDLKMNIRVSLEGEEMEMTFICVAKGVAEALWGAKASTSNNNNPGRSKVIKNVLTGLILQAPSLPQVSQIRTFDFSKLFDRSAASFDWKFTQMSIGEAYHSYDVLGYFDKKKVEGTLEKTYLSVMDKREKIYELLQTTFDDDLPEIQETEINVNVIEKGNNYFKAIPVLCEIGEIPQYSTDVK